MGNVTLEEFSVHLDNCNDQGVLQMSNIHSNIHTSVHAVNARPPARHEQGISRNMGAQGSQSSDWSFWPSVSTLANTTRPRRHFRRLAWSVTFSHEFTLYGTCENACEFTKVLNSTKGICVALLRGFVEQEILVIFAILLTFSAKFSGHRKL
jgi:hypothetical protein